MKLIWWIHIGLLLLTNMIYAQHYRTVISDTAVYFRNSNGGIAAIKIDTVYVSFGDSVYQNFHTARYDNGFAPCYWGYNRKGASWLGERVMLKTDGAQIFFNKNNDSIVLKTFAAAGESWKLFDLGNGSFLEGSVVSTTPENIFGITDSVKTIAIQAKDSIGNSIAHPLNGKRFKVAKYLGFTGLLHFYEFPDDTNQFFIYNKGIPTKREMFDFEVGDKIQRRTITGEYEDRNVNIYSLYTYLAKSFSGDSNTVYYTIERDSHYYHYTLYPPRRVDWEYHNKDTITITYTDLNQPVINEQPGELATAITIMGFLFGEYSLQEGHPCGTRMDFLNHPGYEESDSCIGSFNEGSYTTASIIGGLGIISSQECEACSTYGSWEQGFQYYEKSDCSHGTLFTGAPSPQTSYNDFSIFPNPAADKLTINFTPAANQTIAIVIHDIAGKRIYSSSASQHFPLSISTTHWNAGCYFVTIHTEAGSARKKLLIQQ